MGCYKYRLFFFLAQFACTCRHIWYSRVVHPASHMSSLCCIDANQHSLYYSAGQFQSKFVRTNLNLHINFAQFLIDYKSLVDFKLQHSNKKKLDLNSLLPFFFRFLSEKL